jgi:hypothetical protein
LKSLSRRVELVRVALGARLRDVCQSIRQLRPSDFGEHDWFIQELQAQASSSGTILVAARQRQITTNTGWFTCDRDCLEALCMLALGEDLTAASSEAGNGSSDAPPVEPFLASLYAAKRDPAQRQRLLLERYGCPLNIAADSEARAREHLLERLMVQDRARVESGAIDAADNPDVLLKLNLLAVYAARATDLRYVDALNYYYELFMGRDEHEKRSSPLFASYLGLYARALYAWLNQQLSE